MGRSSTVQGVKVGGVGWGDLAQYRVSRWVGWGGVGRSSTVQGVEVGGVGWGDLAQYRVSRWVGWVGWGGACLMFHALQQVLSCALCRWSQGAGQAVERFSRYTIHQQQSTRREM